MEMDRRGTGDRIGSPAPPQDQKSSANVSGWVASSAAALPSPMRVGGRLGDIEPSRLLVAGAMDAADSDHV